MRKWICGLCVLLVFNAQAAGVLRERVSLEGLRKAGIPVEIFQEAGVEKEEIVLYLSFWKDLVYFPAAGKYREAGSRFFFENSWLEERNFGGNRVHEGCDIFGEKSVSGFYPVVSMTAGVVEKIGWLPLGGWRIGIRSPGGGYFYYAHLSSYAADFQEGDSVEAGEMLGFLGDTGYGEKGTTGQFPPHLHMGIYVRTEKREEYPLNPYPVLEFLQDKQKNFFY